jgi:PIN domain nuclease of toxin-antitoxin system
MAGSAPRRSCSADANDEGTGPLTMTGACPRESGQPTRSLFSAATAWEIAIKSALRRITATGTVAEAIADYGFIELPILVGHADAVGGLPLHHRDPFDRMLVAQAGVESLKLVSRDPALRLYDAGVVWA